MTNSVNTNVSALVALQNLNSTNRALDSVQNRVSTGLRITGAKDDASSFAIAQGIRGDLKAFSAVSQGIANAKGVMTVALAAATEISNLAGDIQAKVTQARNAANTTAQQTILNADFSQLVNQIQTFIANASYNGRNLLKTTAMSVNVIANIDGSTLILRSQSAVQQALSSLQVVSLGSLTAAASAAVQIDSFISVVNTALGELGADSRALDFQANFIEIVTDAQEVGLGSIVDADLARESAKLQSLQVKQQLGVQTLGIANQRPQALLGLFNG